MAGSVFAGEFKAEILQQSEPGQGELYEEHKQNRRIIE